MYGNKDPKAKKMAYDKKTITLWCCLISKNENFRPFPMFDFALNPKAKSWKPRKVLFCFNFCIWNPRSKNQKKNDLRQRKLQLCMNFAVLFNKKKKCPRFASFQFWPISKIKKTEILESLLYFNFETQDPKTRKMIWDKENYNFTMWFNKKNNENFRGF